ncbi:hypothetical protein LTR73_002993 [Friedmanniomyces endolithicus]|nr:hypothetical protein LTR73_002993 [Friedmanniomyces endolithicus]
MPFVVFFELFGRVLYVQFSRPPPPPPPPPPLVVAAPCLGATTRLGPGEGPRARGLPSPELAPEEEPELIHLDDANRPLPEVPWLLDENWEPVR